MLGASGVEAEQWIAVERFGQTLYFAFASPARVERFDVGSGSFSPSSISLATSPTAIAVDASGLYVARSQSVYRYNLDGTGESFRFNAPAAISSLAIVGNFIIAVHSGEEYISANKFTGTIIDSQNLFYRMVGLSVDTSLGSIFGRSTGVSPADIVSLSINLDGTIGLQDDSPYHGDFKTGNKTFTDATSGLVLDSSGTAYMTSGLALAGSLAGNIEHAVFAAAQIVVVRGTKLLTYGYDFLESGIYTPPNDPAALAVEGSAVYSFYPTFDVRGVGADSTTLSAFVPAAIGPEIDPAGHVYTPDQIVYDGIGRVFLLDAVNRSAHIWSTAVQKYVGSIPLHDSPSFMAYSADSDTLYFGYGSGKITQVDLSGPFDEVPFVNVPNLLEGLATARDTVFTFEGNAQTTGRAFYTFDSGGVLVEREDFGGYYSQEYVWEPVLGRMYHLRDDTSPNDLLYTEINLDGTIGATVDSPYHGDFGFSHPVRVSPAGDVIVIGTGRIFNSSLVNVNFLPQSPRDVAWRDDHLFTIIEAPAGRTSLRRWSGPGYAHTGTVNRPGTALALFDVTEGLLVVHQPGAYPQFTMFDANFQLVLGPSAPLHAWPVAIVLAIIALAAHRIGRPRIRPRSKSYRE